jgi:hypothetical protein
LAKKHRQPRHTFGNPAGLSPPAGVGQPAVPPPRRGPDGDAPGSYELVPRLSAAVVNPGESVELDVFLAGYGRIGSSKLVLHTPPDAVDPSRSKVWSDIAQTEKGFEFGKTERPLDPEGFVARLGGVNPDGKWDQSTFFFDADWFTSPSESWGTPPVMTEASKFPPFRIRIQVPEKVRPGRYAMFLLFSYFNGQQWCASHREVAFQVTNTLQRHEGIAWVLGVGAALAAIAEALKGLFG